jgi:hypothetical protein
MGLESTGKCVFFVPAVGGILAVPPSNKEPPLPGPSTSVWRGGRRSTLLQHAPRLFCGRADAEEADVLEFEGCFKVADVYVCFFIKSMFRVAGLTPSRSGFVNRLACVGCAVWCGVVGASKHGEQFREALKMICAGAIWVRSVARMRVWKAWMKLGPPVVPSIKVVYAA